MKRGHDSEGAGTRLARGNVAATGCRNRIRESNWGIEFGNSCRIVICVYLWKNGAGCFWLLCGSLARRWEDSDGPTAKKLGSVRPPIVREIERTPHCPAADEPDAVVVSLPAVVALLRRTSAR